MSPNSAHNFTVYGVQRPAGTADSTALGRRSMVRDGVAGSIPAGGSTPKPQGRSGPVPGLFQARRALNRHLPEICQKTPSVVVRTRLVDACYLWAFAALTASPGARRCYDAHRARGASHHQALRALGNRLVGILHGCLAQRVAYQEQLAWPAAERAA
jgi:hypothetical protein